MSEDCIAMAPENVSKYSGRVSIKAANPSRMESQLIGIYTQSKGGNIRMKACMLPRHSGEVVQERCSRKTRQMPGPIKCHL